MLQRVLIAAALAAASAKGLVATFDGDATAPFVESANARYADQDVGIVDGALMLKEANRMYGVAAPVTPPFKLDDTLVIQYESTLTDGLTCGGAYVKLLEAPVDAAKFDNESPYVLMFGPDRCGATDKVHFIVRQQNAKTKVWHEHHLRDAPRAKADRAPHLYKAVIKSDDTFSITIDDEEAFSGSLMDALEPPLTPPKEIDDPDDSKPADWVDAAKIDDPAASKPSDWDEDAPRQIDDASATMPSGWLVSEPDLVPDASASAPDDWDDEEDGEWEAPEVSNPLCDKAPGCGPWSPPRVDNPAYKGKWYAEQIDNPAYKGPWAPKKIANKEYFEPKHPAKNLKAIGAVAVEVWTTNGGIAYDNFYLGASGSEAKTSAASYYTKKAAEEALAEEKKSEKAAKRAAKGKGWRGLLLKAKKLSSTALDLVLDQPLAAGGTVAVLLVTLLLTLRKKKAPAEEEDDEEDEEEKEESEDEEPAPRRGRRRTPKAE